MYVVLRLKRHNQAKIVKKSVILFWILDKTISCKHVHTLELQKFFIFCAAHLPVKRDIGLKTKFPIFITDMHVQNKKYGNI